jgi:SAM-dependent methyltransferase
MATEAEKILSRIRPFLENRSVLDIGCGMNKIVPWASGADHFYPNAELHVDISPDSDQLAKVLADRKFDIVFSSHAIEHIRAPIADTLRHFFSFVRKGGHLILYLPHEGRYVFDPSNSKARNPEHYHYLTPETFRWHLDQIQNLRLGALEEDPHIHNRYSFLVIADKM